MALTYQRLRAPEKDGQSLQVPALSAWPEFLSQNQLLLSGHSFEIGGVPVQSLRAAAREELIQIAVDYSRQYRDVNMPSSPRGIVMAGHQPTLFHPGVWYKNFALDHVAGQTDSVAINLVVDNDHNALRSIGVPTGSIDEPRVELVKFDSRTVNGPFETEKLHSRETFNSFGDRAAEAIKPFVAQPLVNRLWPYAISAVDQMQQPSLAIAAGRHRLEADCGLQTLEIPISRICQTRSFACFAAELFSRAAEFRRIHNQKLHDYRQLNRLRSTSHPVPDLTENDGWGELPFWIWRAGTALRHPLFVKTSGTVFAISDQRGIHVTLDSRQNLSEQISGLEAAGICIRTRALTTTMYSRLVLSDLFVHGIGGGKYDQLTDEIIREFFQVEAPAFAIATATYRLPVDYDHVMQEDLTRLKIRLREMRFHAELFGDYANEAFQAAADRKSRHLNAIPANGDKKVWHDELESINEELCSLIEGDRVALESEIESTEKLIRVNQVLGSREFSFCLFDERLIEALKD